MYFQILNEIRTIFVKKLFFWLSFPFNKTFSVMIFWTITLSNRLSFVPERTGLLFPVYITWRKYTMYDLMNENRTLTSYFLGQTCPPQPPPHQISLSYGHRQQGTPPPICPMTHFFVPVTRFFFPMTRFFLLHVNIRSKFTCRNPLAPQGR